MLCLMLASGLIAAPASAEAARGLQAEASAWKRYAVDRLQAQISPAVSASPLGPSDPQREASLRLAMSVEATAGSGAHLRLGGSAESGPLHLAASFRDGSGFALGLTSNVLAPEVVAAIGADSRVRFGLTIANQRFATAGFGESMPLMPGTIAPLRDAPRFVEQSFGQGVHAGFESPLGERFMLGVQVQSRIDMEPFKSYRGFFTEPGDFDLPARAGVSLGWNSEGPLSLGVSVERVYYSEISAFTSRALPPRLLALLSDGSSPRFAWRDLTVYSAELGVQEPFGGRFGLRLSSRLQPSPTSALLDLALSESYSDTNVSATYRREIGAFGALTFGASYAPYQPVLGIPPMGNRYRDGSQLEAELNWSVAF